MSMQLLPPLKISSRLLAAVEIEGTWISIEPTARQDQRGAPYWRIYIDKDRD